MTLRPNTLPVRSRADAHDPATRPNTTATISPGMNRETSPTISRRSYGGRRRYVPRCSGAPRHHHVGRTGPGGPIVLGSHVVVRYAPCSHDPAMASDARRAGLARPGVDSGVAGLKSLQSPLATLVNDEASTDSPTLTPGDLTLPGSGQFGLTPTEARIKRAVDVLGAGAGIALLGWLILGAWAAATIDTRANGFFRQERVGKDGHIFRVIKIRSMRPGHPLDTSVTTAVDPRITRLGRLLRRTKIDELPQLFNVLVGEMSLVGPRPEVPGFADLLQGEDARILSVRPGITGPATLFYRNEEALLAASDDPEAFNRTVLFPTKVRMNLEYIRTYSLGEDLRLLKETIL